MTTLNQYALPFKLCAGLIPTPTPTGPLVRYLNPPSTPPNPTLLPGAQVALFAAFFLGTKVVSSSQDGK